MKLYKYAFVAVLVGLSAGLSSCKNEEDDIFDGSAAQRLDEYKKLYTADLTANGGKWLMEYFTNEEEHGYAFIVTFNTDGTVIVSGQNEWFSGTLTSDRSLWSVIADNGPVLSFNSYNSVLHEFSRPDNITGPYAPTNPDNNNADINETGMGHAGDYEFVILGLSEDGMTMHLTGKKTLYDIYLRKLDSSVDDAEILAGVHSATMTTFSASFPDLILTDTNSGERFIVNGGDKGLFNAWPEDGDAVVQTSSMNAIILANSIRFRKPFAVERANSNDSIVVETLTLQTDGTYLCTDNNQNLVLDNCGYGNIFTVQKYSWKLTPSAEMGGEFLALFSQFQSETLSALNCSFNGITWTYVNSEKRMCMQYLISRATAGAAYIYGSATVSDDGKTVKFDISTTEGNSNGRARLNRIPSLPKFFEKLNSTTFVIESTKRFAPTKMKFVDVNNPENYLVFSM